MKRLLPLILFLFSYLCSAASINWYDNFIFTDQSFTYEFVRTLGYTYTGGSDIGECVSTARLIKEGDINSWYQQWLSSGNRLYSLGESFLQQKNITSAQQCYFRAANYFRTASFYYDAPQNRAKAIQAWQRSRIAFLRAITQIPYIRTVKIPYLKTYLPGYFIATKAKNAPLLIVNTGFDGTAEELYFAVGLQAHKRGYNVLLVEGPGQGEVIKLQNIPFRYDWEHVITPVINFSEHLPNVDHSKIALMGLSMGGYLAARAAAFEPRLKAVILNGGVYDMFASVASTMPNELVNLATQSPSQFNALIEKQMTKDINAYWFFNNARWVFKVKTPADVLKTLKKYNLEEVVEKITCATLVIDSVDDQFFKGQPQQVYKLLTAPKTIIHFTPQEAAQAHCQVGAIAISNEMIFNWLDQTLNWHPIMIN